VAVHAREVEDGAGLSGAELMPCSSLRSYERKIAPGSDRTMPRTAK
jgi:hypothetical protein